ncbi:uncharacterized protein VICG_00313 [Vittaforma corneae ATCC 50505]|uniref:Calponin-homology (CH) domain-containing protein n=1 Tax=Vittaforma corneae (strain ATCC 50505) TaxID=993615 RepID=L2GNZ6_VITCO|nr:uncharacterized protein VICG_00313 [Vittaforma corneae ATCC 50505]ELA42561.1 hypothetical protein VICG_00313 [Vittaforma corneae ATCC 50505]
MVQQDTGEAIGSLISGKLPSSSEVMDAKRTTSTLRDFLLKLDQAREWICSVAEVSMDITAFREDLPKAEILARVVQAFDPSFVKRIYVSAVREFRHTDNIMLFLNWCKKIKLRRHFLFETVDLYESKNIPKVIYCIHGLALFLNKRGMGRGIVVKNDVVFTYAENSLFAEDLNNISMQKYDDIHTKLDSEDTNDCENVLDKEISEDQIRAFAKTLVWCRGFNSLVTGDNLSVPILRKFIDFDFKGESASQTIAELQNEIVDFFKQNSIKETEKDSLIHTIRLLHENLNQLRNVPVVTYPSANDYKIIKKILYRLIHDYKLCFDILCTGFELPFRTLFPDNVIGDFHFSKFIAFNLNNDQDKLVDIARSHFVSSRIFRNVAEAYSTNITFEMNPISIRNYLMNKEAKSAASKALLDEAIDDKAVRSEILKRSQSIIEFIDSKFNFLINLDLPYYVRAFAKHPFFFEYFIEPAIFSSGNSVIAELMNYIFSSCDSPSSQERLYKDNLEFVKTTNIDFSDYAPLKEYLDECRKTFKAALIRSQAIASDVNDYFIQHASVGDLLQVETCIEEINNIILILKGTTKLMSEEMVHLVNKLELMNVPSSSSIKIGVYSQLDSARMDASVQVNGQVAPMTRDGSKGDTAIEQAISTTYSDTTSMSDAEKYREVEFTSEHPFETSVPQSASEKFVLKLDNQYSSELDEEYNLALNAVLKDLKYRLMILISMSEGRTLDAVLNETFSDGYASAPVFSELDIQSIKDSVINDISLLKNKGIFKGNSGHYSLLQMIASDILTCKYRLLHKEITMNLETSDALFHKGAMLDRYLQNLYRYLNDFTTVMFVNKSGIFFNREVRPYTKYGTYLMPLEAFRAQVYENLNIKHMYLKISCRVPMVFNISVYLGDTRLCDPIDVRFDTLLRMREGNMLCFDVNEVCCLSVGSTIEIINEKYINY